MNSLIESKCGTLSGSIVTPGLELLGDESHALRQFVDVNLKVLQRHHGCLLDVVELL